MSKDNLVYVGTEDGVAIYAKRENVTGVDVEMQRDQIRRDIMEKAQGAKLRVQDDA